MDLKIKDVAELLNVSETTVRRWLADGKIPAYRINHQYRFSRVEIENWVMSQRLECSSNVAEPAKSDESPAPSRGGIHQFGLYRAIHKGDVYYDIEGSTKEEIIRNTMLRTASEWQLDADVLTELLLDREQMMSTAISSGISVPHTRDFLLNSHHDLVIVVYPKEPIEYGALDGQPVHTLFFMFACDDKRHLNLIAKVAHLASRPGAVDLLRLKPSKTELLEYVKQMESELVEASIPAP